MAHSSKTQTLSKGVPALSKVILALVAAGAGAGVIATQMTAEREGLSLTAYRDTAKIWTICYGHTGRMIGRPAVRPGQTATAEECRALLDSDLGVVFAAMDRLIATDLPDPTRAAVASWTYNVGVAALERSTLRARLNAGDVAGACDEITRWVYAGGKDCRADSSGCRGIVARRQAERELCLMGVDP